MRQEISSGFIQSQPVTADQGGNDQLLYFTSSSLTGDDRHLLFLSDRGGQPNLWVRDLIEGRERPITFNQEGHLKSYVYFDGRSARGLGKASVSLDAPRGRIYFLQGRDLCAVDLGARQRVLARLPEDQVTAFTHVSGNGRWLCVPTTDARALEGYAQRHGQGNFDIDQRVRQEGLNSWLRVFDTRSGEQAAAERVPAAWVTHVQFCPNDERLILYNHEWPSDCGIRRLWLWDGREHHRLRSEQADRHREDWTCHEMWERDGSAIIYHGRYHQGPSYLGRIPAHGGEPVEIPLPEQFRRYGHFTVGQPGVLVTDGYYQASDDPPALGHGGQWISRLEVNWDDRRILWQPLCLHGSSWAGQDCHPHPIFNHRADAVYFVSDRSGRRAVYRVAVPGRYPR